ncbi:MAG: sigma-70 family RNA polymerase sigma factor [Tannerellaceae bacterium]|nr:sigma-70 family RNA polymerase sigma factor [Tannerellaceae bacterium]
MDEQLLVEGCKRAESWAYKQIYEQYAPVMLSICMRYVNDRSTAKDIMHDGFIKVFFKIGQYAGKGSFEGWLKRVFITTALEYLRTKENGKVLFGKEYEDVPQEFDAGIVEKLSADELLACIGQLPKGYRTVFNLFAIEGYSHKEIAGMLDIQESTSKTQFIRAKAQLQKIITQLTANDDRGR